MLPYLDTRVFVPLQLTTEMVCAVLIGAVVFHEPVAARSYAGLALAALGTSLLAMQKPEGQRGEPDRSKDRIDAGKNQR